MQTADCPLSHITAFQLYKVAASVSGRWHRRKQVLNKPSDGEHPSFVFGETQEGSRGLQASRASPGLPQKAQLGAYPEQTDTGVVPTGGVQTEFRNRNILTWIRLIHDKSTITQSKRWHMITTNAKLIRQWKSSLINQIFDFILFFLPKKQAAVCWWSAHAAV